MAVVQDTYNTAPAIGFPGQVANGELSNRVTRTVADVAGIAFGKAVFAANGERDCTATVGTIDTFLGFVMATHDQPVLPGGPAADILPQYRNAGIMDRGAIYVNVTGAGNKRAPIFIEAGTGNITTTAAGNIATNGWRLDDTLAASGLARIARR